LTFYFTGSAGGQWATDPERIDPDDYPPQQPFVRLMTWALCPDCEVQVHALLVRFLLQGIDCPACGAQLLAPPEDASALLAEALRREDELSSRIE
jgi:hypothetical protein